MSEKIKQEVEALRNFGLTEEEIEGYLEFFYDMKNKRVVNNKKKFSKWLGNRILMEANKNDKH